MNLYNFLLFFTFLTSKTVLIEAIEKKIKDINRIEEKIITIEKFLEHALDHQPIKKLLYFLNTNKLLSKEIILNNQYSFRDLVLLINENSLIVYIKKENISKNDIENILNDAFGKDDKEGISLFVGNIFNKIALQEKKEKLDENFNKELEKLNLSIKDIAMEDPKSMNKFIDEAKKKEDNFKNKIDNEIKKQEESLKARIEARTEARKKKKN